MSGKDNKRANTTAKDKFKPLHDDPYDYDACNITASITWLPDDGEPGGRQMVMFVQNHQDKPIYHFCRENELPFEQIIDKMAEMLEQLKAELPERKVEMLKRKSGKKKKTSVSSTSTGTAVTSAPMELIKNGNKTIKQPVDDQLALW